MTININLIIIITTVLTTILAWRQAGMFEKLCFHAVSIAEDKKWYRMLTYGFIHANLGHLFINMFVLWMFGKTIENTFVYELSAPENSLSGHGLYLLFYLSAIVVSTVYDLRKHRDNYSYRAVGASGAVTAVLFAYIVFYPLEKLIVFPIPIPMPAFIFGILYLAYSTYMSRKNVDNIGHATHFWGGIYGLAFAFAVRAITGNWFFV